MTNSIQSIANRTLQIEIEAINGLSNFIDQSFEEVVNDIAIRVDVEGIADQMRRNKSQATMKARGFTLGWHHNKLTPLPADWCYPEGMNLLQLRMQS